MGLWLSAIDRAEKSESTERWTNALLLFFVFSWDLKTIRKIQNNSSLILENKMNLKKEHFSAVEMEWSLVITRAHK